MNEVIEHNFQVGDRVRQHEGSSYYQQSHGCEGTILSIRSRSMFHDNHPISVRWDNGHVNDYYGHNLYKV